MDALLEGPHGCRLTRRSLHIGAACVAILHLLLHVAARRLLRAWIPTVELTAEARKNGQTPAGFYLVCGGHVTGAINALVVGPLGLWAAYHFLMGSFNPSDTVFVHDYAEGKDDAGREPQLCRVFLVSTIGAVFFAGYILFLNVCLLTGWDWGADNVVHHLVFLALTCTTLHYGTLFPELGLFAMAMELSTPFKNAYLVCREVRHLEPYADDAGLVFAISFLLVRTGLFTAAIYRSTLLWLVDPAAFWRGPGATVPFGVVVATQVFYVAGWLLQLWWSWAIVGKVWRAVAAKQVKAAEAVTDTKEK